MALKNTYAKLPAGNYITKIEDCLVKAGATGIAKGYADGRIISLSFLLVVKGNTLNFTLPIGWKKVQQVLKNEDIGRWNDDDYAYRVSWAIMHDWVAAQMAILASENVTMPQLFLPYATAANGQTLFEAVMNSNLLLGNGK